MNGIEWVKLIDVYLRSNAEMLKSYLNAHEIDVRLIQESYEHFAYRFQAGHVEVLVRNDQLADAQRLYEKSGWDFGAAEIDEERTMDELTWAKLTEAYGRMDAELIKSYLEAEGIETELFQEAVGHHIYPTTVDGLAKVQIFVRKEALEDARKLLERFNDRNENNEEAA